MSDVTQQQPLPLKRQCEAYTMCGGQVAARLKTTKSLSAVFWQRQLGK